MIFVVIFNDLYLYYNFNKLCFHFIFILCPFHFLIHCFEQSSRQFVDFFLRTNTFNLKSFRRTKWILMIYIFITISMICAFISFSFHFLIHCFKQFSRQFDFFFKDEHFQFEIVSTNEVNFNDLYLYYNLCFSFVF